MADSIQTEHKPADPSSSESSDAELLELFAGHGVYRDNAAQYRGRLDGRLLINRCADCDRYHQPPRPMCPSCWSFQVVPTPVSGRGTIHLLMHLHAGPPADGVDYSNGGHPVVVVELEEQQHLRVTGTVHGFDLDGPSIGGAVELDFLDRGGVPIVAFRPSRQTEPSHPTEPNRHTGEPSQPSQRVHRSQPDNPNRRDDARTGRTEPNQAGRPNPTKPAEPNQTRRAGRTSGAMTDGQITNERPDRHRRGRLDRIQSG